MKDVDLVYVSAPDPRVSKKSASACNKLRTCRVLKTTNKGDDMATYTLIVRGKPGNHREGRDTIRFTSPVAQPRVADGRWHYRGGRERFLCGGVNYDSPEHYVRAWRGNVV